MNKRIRKKVAKRNHGQVTPHPVSQPKKRAKPAQASAPAARAERYQRRSEGLRSAVRGAARELVRGVRGRASEAVEQLKERVQDRVQDGERRAEELLAKVPAVGPAAARKLHDLTHR